MTLPHTYTDEADHTLKVTALPGPRLVTKTLLPTEDEQGAIEHVASVTAPKGEEAVALAKAVLEAAVDTGCVVTSWREYHEALRNAREEGARSMRERAAAITEQPGEWSRLESPADRIRVLPLLPDEEPTEVRHITDAVGRVLRTDRVPLTPETDA